MLLVYEYNRGQEANRKKSEAQALERDRLRQEAEEERIVRPTRSCSPSVLFAGPALCKSQGATFVA